MGSIYAVAIYIFCPFMHTCVQKRIHVHSHSIGRSCPLSLLTMTCIRLSCVTLVSLTLFFDHLI